METTKTGKKSNEGAGDPEWYIRESKGLTSC